LKADVAKSVPQKQKKEIPPMEKNQGKEEKTAKKGWLGKLFEKLDQKMEAKAREGCCCAKDPKKGSSCC